MKLPLLHAGVSIVLLMNVISKPAHAEILPWLNDDPFNAQDKITAYGTGLRPRNCPGLPDLSKPLKLNEVVIAVLCHNPDTKAAYLRLIASADDYATSYSSYLPTVDATASISRDTDFDGGKRTSITKGSGISASLLLYDFGQREISVEIAEQSLIISGNDYDSSMQGMIATALQSYYNLLTAQNALGVALESQRYAKESYDAAQLRHKLGLVPLADSLQAKGSYSSAELTTQTAAKNLSQSQAALALLMGLSADTAMQVAEVDDSNLDKDPFDNHVKELMEKAKQERVDLKAGRAGLKSAEASLRALERDQLGSITAGVDSNLDKDGIFTGGSSRGHSIGVSVSIPIFNGFADNYNRHAARKNLEAQRLDFIRSELNVEQDVFNAWQNYQTAKQSWAVTWDQLAAATELRDVALGRYKEGIGSILDVLNAQLQYSNALQSQLTTRYDLLTSRVDLVRAVGVLNLDNMVDKTVSTPDPATTTNQSIN